MFPFTYTRQSSVVIPCEVGFVYEVLTDYDLYSEWMPLVAKSKLLAREGDLAIAEFKLVQPLDSFVVECIHTRNRMVLWRTISGRIPLSEARCDLEAAGDGETRVTLTIQGTRRWNRLKSPYSEIMNPARCVRALQAQLAMYLPESVADPGGEKILEISETAEGLICWMGGKKFLLTPLPEGKHDSSGH